MRRNLIAACVGLMCVVRGGLAAAAYLAPTFIMEQLGAAPEMNPQMPYVVRVWAVRDLVLTVLVLRLQGAQRATLLLACVAVDCTDVLSAALAGLSGAHSAAQSVNLSLTAFAALVPEVVALALLRSERLADRAGRPLL